MLVERGAAMVGYKVTCDVVVNPEDFQFLKCSPTVEEGEVHVFLNLGVILRALGSCDGDLPGRGSLYDRARKRVGEVVSGFSHAGTNSVLDAIRAVYSLGSRETAGCVGIHYLVDHMEGMEKSLVSDGALCRRYGISNSELEELLIYIRQSDIGSVINCPALRKILQIDYSL